MVVKRILGFFIWMILIVSACAQEVITRCEFFIGSDPGPGNAEALPTDWDGNLANSVASSIAPDSPGFYRLSVRYKSSNGLWSETRSVMFYVGGAGTGSGGTPTVEQVVAAEYFIGPDPGPGNTTAAPQSWDGSLSTLVATAAGPGSPGFYRLSVRYKSSNGLWSETRSVMFYVGGAGSGNGGTPTVEQVVAAEYFIGPDPGPGNAAAAPQSWDGTLSTLVATAAGPDAPGFYRLGVRYKSSNGLWSETRSVMFYVGGNGNGSEPEVAQIVAAEYFFDTDPGPGNGIALPVEAAEEVDLEALAAVNELSLGNHRFFLRFKSSNDLWSMAEMRSFEVCTVSGPLASFNFIQTGSEVFLESTSINHDSLSWAMGNTVFSHAPFPTYTNSPGIYPVALTAYNVCGEHSVTQDVSLYGISSFSPTVGCNLGSTTVTIHGAGFQPGDELYTLQFSDGTAIVPDTVVISANGGTAIATFNLVGAAPGYYDLLVSIPGDQTYTAVDSFLVTDEIGGSISYAFNVPSVTRPTDWRDYSLVITNNSNLDVEQVPFIIAFPDYADVELRFEIVEAALETNPELIALPVFTSIDSIRNTSYNRKVFLGLCPALTAHSSIVYTVRARMNQLGLANPIAHVFSLSDNQLVNVFNSPSFDSNLRNQISTACTNSSVSLGLDALGAISSLASSVLAQGLNCAAGIGSNAWSTFVDPPGQSGVKAFNFGVNIASTLLSCGLFVGTLAVGPEVALAAPIIGVIQKIGFFYSAGNTASSVLNYLDDCFARPLFNPNNSPQVNVVTSIDPNEIWGINEYNGYTNEETFTYTIFCENLPAAAIPAVEVNIYDTLDMTFFDPSTFRLNSINLPDTIIILPDGVSQFATEYPLANGLRARISAQLDSETGIAHWRMIAIDPVTQDYPLDLSLGLLPPNVVAPEGEAWVSFSINRRTDTYDGQQVDNAADIIFDYNEPIYTNVWENELDLVAPVSAMQQAVSPTDTIIHLDWSASDNRSGVGYYTLYVSENGGPFQQVASGISTDSINLIGQYGVSYGFYVTATDNVGNREVKEPIAETVVTPWPVQLVVEPIITPASCAGADNASIVLSTFGGEGNYTYSWSNGATQSWLENLSPGIYSVIINDSSGQTLEQTFTIEEPATLLVQTEVVQPQCWYDLGSAELQITGGVEPYVIDWNGANAQLLSQGVYPVTVTDANGCETIREVIVQSEAPVEITFETQTTDVLCYGESTGVASFQVLSSNGAVNADWQGENPMQLSAGSYNVVLTDSAGCSVETSFQIAEPLPVEVITQTIDSDSETACNGSIELSISGGTAPYAVMWTIPQGATGTSVSNLCEGTYAATITDANGCVLTEESIQIVTAIGELTGLNQITIMPNPSQGKYSLSVQCAEGGLLNWVVYDEQGRSVCRSYNQWCGPGIHHWPIDLQNEPNGPYLLQLQFEHGKTTRQLLKVGM